MSAAIIFTPKGGKIKMDLDDFCRLPWPRRLSYDRDGYPVCTYWCKTEKKEISFRLHRWVHNPGVGLVVDHINRVKWDCRKENLRSASVSQNTANSAGFGPRAGKPRTSRYKGVCWHKANQKWQAAINIKGRHKYLGLYLSEIDAAKVYDQHAKAEWGEFAYLNFPK